MSPLPRLILLALTLSVAAQAEEKSGHLFILSGQSNMTGQLKTGFRKTVTEALGEENVTVVQSSRSGRGIRFWVEDYELPEGHHFHGKLKAGNGEEFPRLVKAVKDAGDARKYETVHFIWMQGESDANRDLGVAYERSFKTLVSRLKEELGVEQMHFVIGRLSNWGLYRDEHAEAWKRMRTAQQKLAEDDPLGAWINTDDLIGGDEANPPGDLHYSREQSVILGRRFGEAALEQLKTK